MKLTGERGRGPGRGRQAKRAGTSPYLKPI